jgi:2-dehydropantoate 2-reductase
VRYVVVGCGAIGGTVAAGLARDGHEVLVADSDPDVVRAINTDGLRIEGPVEQFTAHPQAVLPADLPERIDGPVLVAVKAHDTLAAAAELNGRLQDDAFVVSLQNGLTTSVLGAHLGQGRVVEAVVNFGADVIGPGVVMRGNRATFLIGELDGASSDRVEALVADIADAQASTQILSYVWAKEAYGATLFATAVSDLPIHAVFENPYWRPLLEAVAAEVLDQAPVQPLPLDGFDPADVRGSLERLAEFNRRSAKTHSGIYRDLAIRHRPTEVRAILGPLQGVLLRRITELIEAIERGERTCSLANLELLATYERLERLGRPLNAVVSVAGAPLRSPAGPLAGQPVAVKDIIAVAGLPTLCGSPASDPVPAAADAELVRRLRAAGAEVFATTQCLEYAAGHAHPDVGDTRNPHDPSRTSGGSSGGSAAVVAAGVCDLAIGTDTGGSIRIPAAYCGIVGLKPTFGLVPVDGVFPLAPSCDHAGTLTADADGAAALLAVIAGITADVVPPPAGCTVGVLSAQLSDPSVTPPVRAAIEAALAALEASGWQLREVRSGWLDDPHRWEEALAAIVGREGFEIHRDRDTGGYAPGTQAFLAYGSTVTSAQYDHAQAEREVLRAAIDASLVGVDVLAGPTVGFQAPHEDPPFGVGNDAGEGRFTGVYNLTGHPAVSMPVPAAGLPIGLQLASRRGTDMTLLRVSAAAGRLLAAVHRDDPVTHDGVEPVQH